MASYSYFDGADENLFRIFSTRSPKVELISELIEKSKIKQSHPSAAASRTFEPSRLREFLPSFSLTDIRSFYRELSLEGGRSELLIMFNSAKSEDRTCSKMSALGLTEPDISKGIESLEELEGDFKTLALLNLAVSLVRAEYMARTPDNPISCQLGPCEIICPSGLLELTVRASPEGVF